MEYKPGIYRNGRCQIILSIDNERWHLSISVIDGLSNLQKKRGGVLPSYHEIKKARYKYCPDNIYMAEIFPPTSEFVNLGEVRHLFEIDGEGG